MADNVARSNEAKNRLLAMLARDLVPSNNAVLGWVQLLQREILDSSARRRALETMERNLELQAKLMAELLDGGQHGTDEGHFELDVVDLRQVVGRVVAATRPSTVAAGIELVSIVRQPELEPSTFQVLGDERRLDQLLSHLLTNATKATPAGGRIEVELVTREGFNELIVRDNGAGMSAEVTTKLFEPPDSLSFATRGGGVGLGLYVVRCLAELHGGTMRARSAGAGEGATFTVTLPRGDGR